MHVKVRPLLALLLLATVFRSPRGSEGFGDNINSCYMCEMDTQYGRSYETDTPKIGASSSMAQIGPAQDTG